MAFVQGLIAAARGDEVLARRRFEEAARGWRAVLATAARTTGGDYLAALVDLGRPPVVGLVEPARELALVDREQALLAAAAVPGE
jgi:hypothetical protein